MRYPLEVVPSPRADTAWAAASLPRLNNQVARSVRLGSSALVIEQEARSDRSPSGSFHPSPEFSSGPTIASSTQVACRRSRWSCPLKAAHAGSFGAASSISNRTNLGVLSNANARYLHEKIPTWNNFVQHPAYDSFWQKHAVEYSLKQATVPNLNVAGWWDQEDFYGPTRTYENLEKNDAKHMNYLIVGPWNHGGWTHGPGDTLGQIPFDSNTGEYFRNRVEAPWFAYWLHDKGSLPLKEALVFQTGSNVWTSFDAWPPREAQAKQLYFGANGKLSFDAPGDGEAFDMYVSDPAHPVPYRHRPVDMTYPNDHPGSWYTWLVQDQRFVDNRPDVLTWQTDELQGDVAIAGQVNARLFVSTTGTDSDWVVKLIDVYPQKVESNWKLSGYELMVADEIFRGRYWKGYDKAEPLVANQVTPMNFSLHTTDHVFKKGHRIMVQVQSTWFPLYDRNPQKFVPNIFDAKEADYQKATQRVYRSREYPSGVEIPVVPLDAGR